MKYSTNIYFGNFAGNFAGNYINKKSFSTLKFNAADPNRVCSLTKALK